MKNTNKPLGEQEGDAENTNKANQDQARKWDKNDPDESNVDHNKPQFERSNLNPNQEQRTGQRNGGPDTNSNYDR